MRGITEIFSLNAMMATVHEVALLPILPKVAEAMESGDETALTSAADLLGRKIKKGNLKAIRPLMLVINQMQDNGYFEPAVDALVRAACVDDGDVSSQLESCFSALTADYMNARPKQAFAKLLEVSGGQKTPSRMRLRAVEGMAGHANRVFGFDPIKTFYRLAKAVGYVENDPEYEELVVEKLYEYSEGIFLVRPASALHGLAVAYDRARPGEKMQADIMTRFQDYVGQFFDTDPHAAYEVVTLIGKCADPGTAAENLAISSILTLAPQLAKIRPSQTDSRDASSQAEQFVAEHSRQTGKITKDRNEHAAADPAAPMTTALEGVRGVLAWADENSAAGDSAKKLFQNLTLEYYKIDPKSAFEYVYGALSSSRKKMFLATTFQEIAERYIVDRPSQAVRLLWHMMNDASYGDLVGGIAAHVLRNESNTDACADIPGLSIVQSTACNWMQHTRRVLSLRLSAQAQSAPKRPPILTYGRFMQKFDATAQP
ncbi:MAG: hypothetical protein IPI58_09010 [Alphaproteobacteria bacterium]|nr:MAG: hypothetical protein IPI58_09010 [Alphaproteobacteria bacterium]